MLSRDAKKRHDEVIDLDTIPVKPESEERQVDPEKISEPTRRGPRGPYGARKDK